MMRKIISAVSLGALYLFFAAYSIKEYRQEFAASEYLMVYVPGNIIIDNDFLGQDSKDVSFAEYARLDPASPKILKVRHDKTKFILSYFGRSEKELRNLRYNVEILRKPAEFVNYLHGQEQLENGMLRVSWKKWSFGFFVFTMLALLIFAVGIWYVLNEEELKWERKERLRLKAV